MGGCCASVGINPGDPIHAVLLLSTGLTTSFAHCAGMCGPLHLAIGAGRSGLPPIASLAPLHAGRLSAYATIGVAFGLAGPAIRGVGASTELQAAISIAASLLMLTMVVLTGLGYAIPHRDPFRFSNFLSTRLRSVLSSPSKTKRFALGYANGFLPCGPVGLVAFAAATARGPLEGGLALFLYGLGTVPVLLLLGAGASWIGISTRLRLARIGLVVLAILSIQLLARGMAALHQIPHSEIAGVQLW
jgi:sulfite exporter TauE/SafE